MLEWLAAHGVDDVVLSCGFRADRSAPCWATARRTACASATARSRAARHRRRAEVLRGPARRALPDAQRRRADRHGPQRPDRAARAHRRHRHAGAGARLDPSNYGLVRARRRAPCSSSSRSPERGRGGEHDLGRRLRARALGARPARAGAVASIERDVFPRLVGNGLHGRVSDGYWLDIGTPERYLQGTFDILEGRVATRVARGGRRGGGSVEGDVRGPAVIGAGATVGGARWWSARWCSTARTWGKTAWCATAWSHPAPWWPTAPSPRRAPSSSEFCTPGFRDPLGHRRGKGAARDERHERGVRCRSANTDWEAIEASPEFQELIAQKRRYVTPARHLLPGLVPRLRPAGRLRAGLHGRVRLRGPHRGLRPGAHAVRHGLVPGLVLRPQGRPGLRPARGGRHRESEAGEFPSPAAPDTGARNLHAAETVQP